MKPTNVLIIMTDQQQARCSAREGFPLDTTPFLDELADRGAWFDHAYTPAPICMPARVSMLTGCFPTATGARSNQHKQVAREPAGNIFRYMQELGYATALIGKNHSHLSAEDFGFARQYMHTGAVGIADRTEDEVRADQWIDDLRHRSSPQPFPFPVECTQPSRIVRDAINWIETQESFFAWVSFPEPHNPYYVPEPYFSMFDESELPPPLAGAEEGRAKGMEYEYLQELQRSTVADIPSQMSRYRANYYGMLRLIDDQVRTLVSFLEQTDRIDNTLVIYVSDHGDYVGDFGLMRKGAGCSESLMRIPFQVFGGGVRQHGRRQEYVSLVDVFPTVCNAVGADVPDGMQGRSLWPLLTGELEQSDEFKSIIAEQGYGGSPANEYTAADIDRWTHPRITFQELGDITQAGSKRILWKNEWKLVISNNGEIGLYHLPEDPAEGTNRADDPTCALVLTDLLSEYARRSLQFEPPAVDPNFPEEKHISLRRNRSNWYRPTTDE